MLLYHAAQGLELQLVFILLGTGAANLFPQLLRHTDLPCLPIAMLTELREGNKKKDQAADTFSVINIKVDAPPEFWKRPVEKLQEKDAEKDRFAELDDDHPDADCAGYAPRVGEYIIKNNIRPVGSSLVKVKHGAKTDLSYAEHPADAYRKLAENGRSWGIGSQLRVGKR